MAKIGRTERYSKKSIGMAVQPQDWEKVEQSHEEDLSSIIERTPHFEGYPMPEEYQHLFSGDETYEGAGPIEGLSKKMVHDLPVGEDTERLMTKPYHPAPLRKSWIENPTQGWATLASKAIYNAADLGDISEKVYTHSHQDVPVVVHHFSKGYNSVYDLVDEKNKNPDLTNAPIQRSVNPLQVMQIAVMDFLMGNNDRHSNNLMVSDHKDQQGYHSLLAIDHDNNFQYVKPLSSISLREKTRDLTKPTGIEADSPANFVQKSALGTALKAAPATEKKTRKLFHDWWVEHADGIRSAFEQQSQQITDPDIKEHIQKNFDRRFQMIQKWSEPDTENNFESTGFFDESYPHVARIVPKPKTPAEVVKQIKARMPTNDPASAIKVIAEAFKKPREKKVTKKLVDLFNSLVDDLHALDLVDLYDNIRNKNLKIGDESLEYALLYWVTQNYDRRAAKELVKYDKGTGKISPQWIYILKQLGGIK